MKLTRTLTALAIGAVCVTATACAGSGAGTGTGTGAGQPTSHHGLKIGATDLSAVCPSKVVIQTDWNPQAEQGGLYNLLGTDSKIDANKKVVSGPLFASDEWTGVDLEVRAGGPAIGFQGVPAQMYSDKDILLGWVNTDEAIANSAKMPTTAVFATFDKAPWMVMWDSKTYPDVHSIAGLGQAGAKVRYFDGATWMDYLVGAGILQEDQIDGSYDGSPGNYLAANGKDAQQGFATVEPYVYENELKDWGKPVNYQLISDTGYPLYAVALSARTADIAAEADCLKKLIPVIQQSTVDYFKNPATANTTIVETVKEFDTGWVYPAGEATNSTTEQLALGLVGNGTNSTLGDFDQSRIEEILDITKPILAKKGTSPAEGLKATDVFTNEFLDPTIALPDSK